jgi:hypothetical protein
MCTLVDNPAVVDVVPEYGDQVVGTAEAKDMPTTAAKKPVVVAVPLIFGSEEQH